MDATDDLSAALISESNGRLIGKLNASLKETMRCDSFSGNARSYAKSRPLLVFQYEPVDPSNTR